jgi:Spy/CpxP family protein refolding chaperone
MKKIVFILFVVAIASSKMLAQGPPKEKGPKKSPEERAEMITKRMTKELALTPEQQTKVKAIVLKRAQERDAKIKEGKTIRDKVDHDFKLILTALCAILLRSR